MKQVRRIPIYLLLFFLFTSICLMISNLTVRKSYASSPDEISPSEVIISTPQDSQNRYLINIEFDISDKTFLTDRFWSNNTCTLDGKEVTDIYNIALSSSDGDNNSLYFLFPYENIEAGKTTSSEIGTHTIIISPEDVLGGSNGNVVMIKKVIITISASTISTLLVDFTDLTSATAGAQDSQTRYLLTLNFDITDSSFLTDRFWNNNTCTLDGKEVSELYNVAKASSNSLYFLFPYENLQSGATAASDIKKHTIIITSDDMIGGTLGHLLIRQRVQIDIEGYSISVSFKKGEVTLKEITTKVYQEENDRYCIYFNTDKADLIDEYWANNKLYISDTIDGEKREISGEGVNFIGDGCELKLYLQTSMLGVDNVNKVDKYLFIPKGTLIGGKLETTNDTTIYLGGKNVLIDPVNESSRLTSVSGSDTTGFYITLTKNQIPSSEDWSSTIYQLKNDAITLNDENVDVFLKKISVSENGETYYVCLQDASISAKENDHIVIDGKFIQGNVIVDIEKCGFVYTNGTWTRDIPTIKTYLNGEEVTDYVISVNAGDPKEILSVKAFGYYIDDTCTVTEQIEDGAIKDSKFILKDGEKTSTYTATWTVTDKDGNDVAVLKTIKVGDKTAPVITIENLKEEYNEGDELSYTVSIVDNVDGDISNSVDVIMQEGMMDENGKLNPGNWTIHFEATDSSLNTAISEEYTITVKDITAPVITAEKNETIVYALASSDSSLYTEYNVTAIDNVDNEFTFSIDFKDAVQDGKYVLGEYDIEITCTDKSGNTGRLAVKLLVKDITPPTISIIGSNLKEGDDPSKIEIKVHDDVDGDISEYSVDFGGAVKDEKLVSGTYTITVTAKDASGNEETSSSKVLIEAVDNTAPAITAPESMEFTEGDEFSYSAVTAIDETDGAVNVTFDCPDGMLDDSNKLVAGNYTVTFKSKDSSGNESTKSVSIIVNAKESSAAKKKGCSNNMNMALPITLILTSVSLAAFVTIKRKEE